MKKYAYIDLETSGLDNKTDEIIRFCAMIINSNGKTELFDKYAKPAGPLDSVTENLVNITNAFLDNCAPSAIVMTEFLDKIAGATIVGVNLDFAERFLGTAFADKIDLSADRHGGDALIKRRLIELRESKLSTAVVQRALQCTYPKARDIIEILQPPTKRKFDHNFFNMDKVEQKGYLQSLIDSATAVFIDDEYVYAFHKLAMELDRIEELNLIPYFLLAKSIAEILKTIDSRPHFVGMGCCSLIAFIIGITEEELNPLDNGLIFERGFRHDHASDCYFYFYVEENIKDELFHALRSCMAKI